LQLRDAPELHEQLALGILQPLLHGLSRGHGPDGFEGGRRSTREGIVAHGTPLCFERAYGRDGIERCTNQDTVSAPETINLWLDDIRPAPIGWLHVTTIAEAKRLLEAGRVKRASLDHDLGACEACMGPWREGLTASGPMPHCSHVGTGYDLCLWMAETGHWPVHAPIVHSANPVGRERMQGVIRRYFGTKGGA